MTVYNPNIFSSSKGDFSTETDEEQYIAGRVGRELVLVCQPDARDDFKLYDSIVNMVTERVGKRIYSPHEDFRDGEFDLENIVDLTAYRVVPKSKLVLVNLSVMSPDVRKMFASTTNCRKPFIIFYGEHSKLDKFYHAQIRAHSAYKGEIIYDSEHDAVAQLEDKIRNVGIN